MDIGVGEESVVVGGGREDYGLDPVGFVTDRLGAKPWSKQREILDALARHNFVAVRSCNGSGKTYTAALATIWWVMAHEEAAVITTAPTERQVKELLWREIRAIYARKREHIGGKLSANRLELSPKRFAFGFSTNTAEHFQGFHSENVLVIVDEASGVKEVIFEAILGIMSAENSKLLLIGNPTNLAGSFYDAFHKKRELYHTIHISAFDTPAFTSKRANNLSTDANDEAGSDSLPDRDPGKLDDIPRGIATPTMVENLANHHGTESSAYMVRVLGDFPNEADDTLIALRFIEDAARRRFDDDAELVAVMGVDVARFGSDQTVAVVRRGPQVIDVAAFGRSDLMTTTGRVLDIANSWDVEGIYVDEVGLGAAVVDRLNELEINHVYGINGGMRARRPERFLNLRAEMFDGLRQRFADGEIVIPNDPELISQLASLTFTYNSRGQLQIESKEQIRRSGRQSPDKADALALAFNGESVIQGSNPLKIWVLGRKRNDKSPLRGA